MTQVKAAVLSGAAPAAIGPYSQGVRTGHTLYISGQLGLDPDSGEMVSGGAGAQAARAMQNVGAILEAAGLDWSTVVRTTIYLSDMADFGEVNQIYAGFVSAPYPSRACVAVAALPRNGLVEIEAVAVDPAGDR